MYVGYLIDLSVFKNILGSFSPPLSKWRVTQKRLAVERNEVKFGTPGVVVTCIWGTFGFDLLVLKVTLGSFDALVSKWPVTRKYLVIE